MDFGSEADEDIGHGIADFFGVRDHDSLAVAQDDMPGDAHDRRVVRDAAQPHRAVSYAPVVAYGDVAEDFGSRTDDDVVAYGGVSLAFLFPRAAQGYPLIH